MSDVINSNPESADKPPVSQTPDIDPVETKEWIESLEYVINSKGPERAKFLLSMLEAKAKNEGVDLPMPLNTPYINTCLLYTSPSPRDRTRSRMPSSA